MHQPTGRNPTSDSLNQESVESDEAAGWNAAAPHIRKMIQFVKRRGRVTAEELVEWDRAHGCRVFDWNDTSAAEEWRKQQARCFLNSFRRVFEGMRVRAFIHVREDETRQIAESGYVTVEAISAHAGMRDQVIEDITRRMRMLASELRLWKLSRPERDKLFRLLAEAIGA